MLSETLILLLVACVLAMAIAWFQYLYPKKRKEKLFFLLAFIRFCAIFGLLLLLLNPKFTKTEFSLKKADLLLLIDNSASIKALGAVEDVTSVTNLIVNNKSLSDKFNIQKYAFGERLNVDSVLTFDQSTTNIYEALVTVDNIYGNNPRAVVLITDGNQTLGNDYEFINTNENYAIYPIAVGDTTQYQDLNIERVNSNTFTFLKNKFPLEIFTNYQGAQNVSTQLSVIVDGTVVYKQNLDFSPSKTSQIISTFVEANSVGIKKIKIKVEPLSQERNIQNNEKQIAVEVVDEKTKIALVSDILHPDIGTLIQAIESNQQRTVTVMKPTAQLEQLSEMDIFILYQPNSTFGAVYEFIKNRPTSTLTITGSQTDWNFLNRVQTNFSKDSYGQKEAIYPVLNNAFGYFEVSDFSLDGFPPLEGILGEITINKQSDPILNQRIRGVDLNAPLLTIFPEEPSRGAVLFGENIWKWRMQSYRNEQNFKKFDAFISKIILFLSMTETKNRFNVEYSPMYANSKEALIKATYFDETFIFDPNANVVLQIIQKQQGITKEVPMVLKGDSYVADLADLLPGEYHFTARVSDGNTSKSGSFTIQDFQVEQQFMSTNHHKLNRLAMNSNGSLYFVANSNELIQNLLEDPRFSPTQKSKQNVVPLIDFKMLLALIVLALALEWFIRKYNGLN